MPYANEHAARIKQPSLFQKNSFRRIKIKTGIDAIIGKLKGQTSTTTQAYRFNKNNYTAAQAKKWLKDHNIKYISFEEAKKSAMKKELYIYSPIYSYTAEVANKQLAAIDDSDDLTIRLNSPGGEVNSGFAFLSKLSERKTSTTAIIDGQAKSMAAYFLPFFDSVIANDTSEIMFHKAAYPDWYKPSSSEELALEKTNQKFEEKMRAKVEGKVGAEKFLKKLFEKDKRNDVDLTPQEALKLGIVNEIRTIDIKAYEGMQIVALAENGEIVKHHIETEEIEQNINNNSRKMTLEEFKAENPALYAQVFNNGKQAGVDSERDRVGAWMAFVSIDQEAVAKGIKEGNNLSQTAMAEFTAKGIGMARVGDHNDDNASGTNTSESGKTEDEKKKEVQDKEAKEALAKYGL